MKLLFCLVSAGFALVAPIAHADDASYLAYIHDHGVPAEYGVMHANPPDMINLNAGEAVCDALRHGKPLPYFGRPYIIGASVVNYQDIIIDGAQHQLCPDTLH